MASGAGSAVASGAASSEAASSAAASALADSSSIIASAAASSAASESASAASSRVAPSMLTAKVLPLHIRVFSSIHFRPDSSCLPDRYGIREIESGGNTIWYAFSTQLGNALAQEGFDRDKTLRRMREEKLIRTGAKGLTMQKRMANGSRPHCVCIDGDALYAFLEAPKPETQQRLDLSLPDEAA